MQFKYGLDPSSKKYPCPQCGHKSCFVVYLDNESKQPVDVNQFGRCDRENNCCYHLAPWTDPELAEKARKEFVPTPDPEERQIYPSDETVHRITQRTKTCVSPFHRFCNKLTISNDHLMRFGVYSDDEKTVFVFRNTEERVVNMKWFKYKDDGHRDHDFKSFSLKNPPPPPQVDGTSKIFVEKHKLCLFGEHLLDKSKARKVIVVESEKTAAMASFFYKDFDWVSCASNNGLTDEKIRVLHNRTVIWLCDADAAGRNNKSIERASQYISEFYLVDLFPDRSDGYDIADAICDGIRPDIKTDRRYVDLLAEPPKIENDDAYNYDLPEGVEFEKVKWDIRKYMHFEHDGKIYIVRKRKGRGGPGDEFESRGDASYYSAAITNFAIRSLGLIDSDAEENTRLVEIKNIHGFETAVKVPTKAFVSQTEFTNFMESVGNFQYDGVGNDLKKIRAKLYDNMLTFEEIYTLGWHHTGYFLFANGAYNGKFSAIDKYGFVKLGQKNFFIQPLSAINKGEGEGEEWEDEKKFLFKERKEVTLKEWADLFCKVHKDNGMIALAWHISALFRDHIYKRYKFFPHAFGFGPPGTGKSQLGWSMRATGFTGIVKPFNLNTGTAVAFHREFQQFRNFPAWCDEYDNSIAYERIQALKAAYDGVGHKKSVKDSERRTKATQVNRAIYISGQQLPIADNALFKRVILLQFNQTEFSQHEKELFGKLQQMEEGGLTHITAGFMHFRKLIEEQYYDTFDKVMDDVMNAVTEAKFDVEDRIARNTAIILTTIKILEGAIADRLPYSYEKLKAVAVKNMKSQMSLISNTNETNTFWDIVMFLFRKGEIREGEDFMIEPRKLIKIDAPNEQREMPKSTELLFIRFTKILPLYREAFKRQSSSSASPMDKSSLMHYLQNSKAYIGSIHRHTFKVFTGKTTEGNPTFGQQRTNCYVFNYEMMTHQGVYLMDTTIEDGGGQLSLGDPGKGASETSGTATSRSEEDLPF
jgi:hypothetical protein